MPQMKTVTMDGKTYEIVDEQARAGIGQAQTAIGQVQSSVATLQEEVEELIAEGGEPNVIETVEVNGAALPVSDKTVDVPVPTKVSQLTNDAGYQTAAIETVKVNGTALPKTNKAVDVPVPTKVSQLTNDAGYITDEVDGDFSVAGDVTIGGDISGKQRKLTAMSDTRLTNINFPATGDNTLEYLNATSSIAAAGGKPPGGEAHILKMNWDNTGGWDSMLAIANAGARIMQAATALMLRAMNGSSGTWSDWTSLLDLIYPVGSVCITRAKTNPKTIFGGGTWTLIHKRFKYQIVENVITYNTTNTQNGTSVAVINGEQIEIRLSFASKVELNDTTIAIGQLNLAAIGLTGKYSEYVPFFADAGIAFLEITDTGVIQTQEVISKTEAVTTTEIDDIVTDGERSGPIPPSTSSGQARISVMFGQGSMLDSFCDEFHWVRTA